MGRTEQPGGGDSLTRARHGAPNSHLDRPTAVVVPVVLPQAVVTVDDSGHARIVLDDLNHHDQIDCPDGPISRDELGAVLAGIAEQIGVPVRVEIREPDGSRYADILQPRAPEPTEDPEPSEPFTAKPLLAGGGFLPHETVLVAVVVTTTQARPDGIASLTTLPPRAWSGGEVILFGGASGRVVQRQLPTAPVAHKRRWWR